MFQNVQRQLNELLTLVRQTATYEAGLTLDPATPRNESATVEYDRQQHRKRDLMNMFDLNEFQVVPNPRG